MSHDKETWKYLLEHSQKNGVRPPIITSSDGSGRSWKYDDGGQNYVELDRYVQRARTVSNIESLAAMVIEEGRRAGEDEFPDDPPERTKRSLGNQMTVIFDKKGATFHLDDRDGRTAFRYEREVSWQWTALLEGAQHREHLPFIRHLQKLRPTIVEYPKVLTEFRKVHFSAQTQVESAPTLEQGRAGLVHSLEFSARNGKTKAELPSSIHCVLPFAQGSKKVFETDVEVAIELNEQSKKVLFSLSFADAFALTEEAIDHEVTWFREQVKDLSLLHILEDY